jgi:hypothetical protein
MLDRLYEIAMVLLLLGGACVSVTTGTLLAIEAWRA